MQKFAQLHKIAVVFQILLREERIFRMMIHMILEAGFYLNATQSPWKELSDVGLSYFRLPIEEKNLNVDISRQSVMGHSMGGHGALLLAFQMNIKFRSVSAFAPICNPMESDWGRKQFSAYLGSDKNLRKTTASVVAQQTNFLALF